MNEQKEKKLLEMLRWLSKDWKNSVRQSSDGVFYFDNRLPLTVKNEKFEKRDFQSITFDFNTRKATWYSAYESGHNGDHFGSEKGDIPWENVFASEEVVSTWVKQKLLADSKEEARVAAAKAETQFAEAKLKEMFGV